MAFPRTAFWLIGMWTPVAAAAQEAILPTLDCTLGFDGLHAAAPFLPGAERGPEGGADVFTFPGDGTWSAKITFTSPGEPAHPAVTLRTLRKQVTGIWTADSKACGYGNPVAFDALMAEMKAGDTELTNASREEAERAKKTQSPLGQPAP